MTGSVTQSPRASTRRSRKSIAYFPGVSDKENNTISGMTSSTIAKTSRKTRSKSMGPGGLEVLNETVGNSQKIFPVIRSILKPTIALSPIRQIPPRKKALKASQARETASARDNIDKAMINCDTNELKQVEEALEKEKREILERREARRKSLANRRVSFAPEATLHTWDIVELAEDATTSSEATNSTRRASSASTLQSGTITGNQAILSASTFSDPPSTPVRHDIQVSASPTEQNGIHKENNSNDQSIPIEELESFSSPGDSIISEGSRRSIGHDTDIDLSEDSDEDNDSLEDDTEIRAIDYAESMHSDSSDQTGTTSSSAQLDHSLRRAVIQAGNQDLTFADDVTMDIVDDDTGLIPFPGTINTEIAAESTGKENAKPTSTSGEHIQYQDKSDETTEISMDMTMMIGGIVKNDTGSPNKGKRKSIASTKRRSLARRRSSVDSSILADETMDFVTTYGGIQTTSLIAQSADLEEQDISMDITRAIGNVLYPSVAVELENDDTEQDLSMDLTKAIGVISSTSRSTRSSKIAHKKSTDLTMPNGHSLSPLTEYTEPSENITFNMDLTTAMGGILNEKFDETVGMDITKAIGSILPKDLQANSKLVAKQLMEEEADHGQLTRSPFTQNKVQEGPELTAKSDAHLRSPSRTPNYLNLTRAASARQNTPTKTPGTPSRHLTPQPNRPLTPCKTPPNANISMRKTSPKRLFKKGVSKSPKFVTPSLSTSKDILNSQNLPLVILTPVFRRVSGVGIDQIGIGSPIAAAKLDRRASIGDSTPNFVPSGGKCIRFEDPRTIELELDRERAEEEYRESGLGVMEREVNDEGLDQGSTSALRHMIKSLTPKKNKFKGRKSLAPSAKGILGKRPLELDDEEDEDATPKRLKGNRSPVKSIHLPGPQKDTTLRLGTAPRFTLPGTTIAPVTIEASVSAITPRDHGRFKDAEVVGIGATPPASFDEQIQGIQPEISIAEDVQISLQDFLNLTNIRFMDLTTTKRRHTVATEDNKDESKKNSTGSSLADCVVAGVCTIPMLDLFQHSCRELKKYIAEGRNVVREIEKDTFEENPALFREYMAAAPDVRAIMDNQFKNIKVHARGESKATWYEWRSKLFEGLKSGLVSIHEGLLQDDKFLGDQEELLHGTIPSLIAKHTLLQEEATNLQSQADELANCDQEELRSVRKSLIQREQDIVEKKRLLVELQAELESNKIAVVEAEERKIEVIAEIKEAERVTNENRGWTYEEVKLLKDKVDTFEAQTGWTLHTCTQFNLIFKYQQMLSLSTTINSNQPPPSQLSLTYLPQTPPPSQIQTFFLQNLQTHLSTVSHNNNKPENLKSILSTISQTWSLATSITTETTDLKHLFRTQEEITNPSTLRLRSILLLRAPEECKIQSKLHIDFIIKTALLDDGEREAGIGIDVGIDVEVVYGQRFRKGDVLAFLRGRVGGQTDDGGMGAGFGGWKDAVRDLKAALLGGEILLVDS